MQAVAEVVVFLELAPDERLDPDLAVEQLEQLAVLLQQLDDDERRSFIEFVQRQAERETSDDRRRVLLELPEALGLLHSES
jgi:hypothetical protein